jgi:hypothetical protein
MGRLALGGTVCDIIKPPCHRCQLAEVIPDSAGLAQPLAAARKTKAAATW